MNVEKEAIAQQTCSHCGEPCSSQAVQAEELTFCCQGCKTVYELLADHALCDYYSFDTIAPKTPASGISRKRFEFLDDIQVQQQLLSFTDGRSAALTLRIPNIQCTSCVWLLENLQSIDAGIIQGSVNFMKRTLTLRFDPTKTSLKAIAELLTTIGYEPDLKLGDLDAKKASSVDRSLWLKLGVAGFAFGNIMLFSFPEYLGVEGSSEDRTFVLFFGALNILLALPVLIYSASEYLKSAWSALIQGGINLDVPITIGIIALFGRSLYEILSETGAGYMDSFTGFIFFLLIGKVVHRKTFDRLSFDRDYRSYLPISVLRLIGTKEESVAVDQLQTGDRIAVRNQEILPSDSVLTSDKAFVDYSFITGEADQVELKQGDLVFAGVRIIDYRAEFLVKKEVDHSYISELWQHDVFKKTDTHKSVRSFADRISPYFTVAVIGIAILACLVWLQIDPSKAFTIFTAVLIVACPCALALSTPFTLGSAINILSLNGLYLKSTDVIEKLAGITTLIFDKTGTLTNTQKTRIEFVGTALNREEQAVVKALCKQSIHPISKKIVQQLEGISSANIFDLHEVKGQGLFASSTFDTVCVGSLDFVEKQCTEPIASYVNESTQFSYAHVAISGIYRGAFVIKNELREGLEELIQTLKHTFNLYLVSGDQPREQERFAKLFNSNTQLLFSQSPEDKLAVVEQLKATGEEVAMIGDGLNDAGALQASQVGIAVSDNTSSFSPASDAIINGNKLKKLHTLIRFSKVSIRVILASFGLSLLYNITGLGFAITGHLSPLVAAILMPLSSVSVMIFTSAATRLAAYKMRLQVWE